MTVLTKTTVGIVEDDAAIRDSLRILLGARGIKPRCFASAAEFLASGEIDSLGALLIDQHMPGIDGVELLEVLRNRNVLTPAIMMTGGTDPNLENRAKKAGALTLLHKPLIGDELKGWLHLALVDAASKAANGPAGAAHAP